MQETVAPAQGGGACRRAGRAGCGSGNVCHGIRMGFPPPQEASGAASACASALNGRFAAVPRIPAGVVRQRGDCGCLRTNDSHPSPGVRGMAEAAWIPGRRNGHPVRRRRQAFGRCAGCMEVKDREDGVQETGGPTRVPGRPPSRIRRRSQVRARRGGRVAARRKNVAGNCALPGKVGPSSSPPRIRTPHPPAGAQLPHTGETCSASGAEQACVPGATRPGLPAGGPLQMPLHDARIGLVVTLDVVEQPA